jgi:hypothetical protein
MTALWITARPRGEGPELKGRVARPVEDLDEKTIKVIASAEVPARYKPLDELNNG